MPTRLSAQVNWRRTRPPPERLGIELDTGAVGVTALRVGATSPGRTAWLALGTSAAGPHAYQPPG
jgi:hypothetical protein